MHAATACRDYGETNFVTGLRAFAALGVVLIHTGGGGLREFGPIGAALADLGRSGVQVFFVVSGFSVAASYVGSGGYGAYLNKRLWRIAPLYWFWLTAAILLDVTAVYWQERFGVVVDTRNVVLHFTFLSVFDYRVTNSILGVEWSIPIEVAWYLAIPAVLAVTTTRARTLAMVGVAVAIGYTLIKNPRLLPVDPADASAAMGWSPLPYVLPYGLGIAAFRLRPWCVRSVLAGDRMVWAVAALIGPHVALIGLLGRSPFNEFVLVSGATAALLLFGRNDGAVMRRSFGLRAARFVGTVSYGLYLCHLPMMALLTRAGIPLGDSPLLAFLGVAGVSVAVSTVTHVVMERPLMDFGARVGERFGGGLGALKS
ncbi:acyltransferase [Siculibacillus lacustris]|uniref:Acyltransferase n=1 Tax=Siculibacillus lacustris TaxID=1549641 RepID=A0A4V2KSY2_9HYPH|nr:acyltransferase [Siculibacillus lacustris]TBW34876.1 acyltransferase [Siculibacillus lacustris]